MPLEGTDNRWDEMNLFRVKPEVEGIVLPSLKHLRIRDIVLTDPGFANDFNFFEQQRARLQCPVDIVEAVEKRSGVFLRRPL
jgi:hypothetical protein